MDPILRPEHELLQQLFAEFRLPFSARARQYDSDGQFPSENFAELRAAGLLGLLLPAELGGKGQSYLAFTAAIEEVARGCASTGLCLAMHYSASSVLARITGPQQKKFADQVVHAGKLWTLGFSEPGSGSHFLKPQTTARSVEGGYSLNGEKSFVTSAGAADYILINSVLEGSREGAFTLFAVPAKEVQGLTLQARWDSMGMRANDSRSVRFTDCRVPQEYRISEEHKGLDMMRARPPFVDLGLASDSIGIAQAALDLATDHLKSRTIEGKIPLSEYQSLRFMLADMSMAVESSRLFVRRGAWVAENKPQESALAMTAAKCVANECATFVANKALQLIGGRGYVKGHPIERLVRDARAGSLMAFTTEQARDMIGRAMVGMNPMGD